VQLQDKIPFPRYSSVTKKDIDFRNSVLNDSPEYDFSVFGEDTVDELLIVPTEDILDLDLDLTSIIV
jgi:hypothetical protein